MKIVNVSSYLDEDVESLIRCLCAHRAALGRLQAERSVPGRAPSTIAWDTVFVKNRTPSAKTKCAIRRVMGHVEVSLCHPSKLDNSTLMRLASLKNEGVKASWSEEEIAEIYKEFFVQVSLSGLLRPYCLDRNLVPAGGILVTIIELVKRLVSYDSPQLRVSAQKDSRERAKERKAEARYWSNVFRVLTAVERERLFTEDVESVQAKLGKLVEDRERNRRKLYKAKELGNISDERLVELCTVRIKENKT